MDMSASRQLRVVPRFNRAIAHVKVVQISGSIS